MDKTDTPILQAKGLRKNFTSPALVSVLKGVDLTVYPGETVAIMGRSGQGKSTLLHILGTLESPCEGLLQIANQKVNRFNQPKIRNHHLAFVFQAFHLLEDYSALDNVLMPARISRKDTSKGSAYYNKALSLLNEVDLKERALYNTKQLSGGEKQRVAIARAVLNDPDIIFADEPTGNLDKETAEQIHNFLINYVKENNKSLVVVTHDPVLAARCSRHYHLVDGILEHVPSTP